MVSGKLALARSDHPNDCTVTSSRLISILRRHSYSEDRTVLMLCNFSFKKTKEYSVRTKKTNQAAASSVINVRVNITWFHTNIYLLTHCSLLRDFFSTGFPTEPFGRSSSNSSTYNDKGNENTHTLPLFIQIRSVTA